MSGRRGVNLKGGSSANPKLDEGRLVGVLVVVVVVV